MAFSGCHLQNRSVCRDNPANPKEISKIISLSRHQRMRLSVWISVDSKQQIMNRLDALCHWSCFESFIIATRTLKRVTQNPIRIPNRSSKRHFATHEFQCITMSARLLPAKPGIFLSSCSCAFDWFSSSWKTKQKEFSDRVDTQNCAKDF